MFQPQVQKVGLWFFESPWVSWRLWGALGFAESQFSTYHAAQRRPLSERAIRDTVIQVAIFTVWQATRSMGSARCGRRCWSGMVYVSCIIDVFSRTIAGWRVAMNMRTDMVLESIEMAGWSTRPTTRRADLSLRPVREMICGFRS